MEALFGDMLAKGEQERLHKTFGLYETIISVMSLLLFATTAVLIIPFVRIYTAGITDADYHEPVFALLLILSSVLYCFRMPYHSLVVAAGHFKQTRVAAYGEAVVNVVLSVLLVSHFGLVGVAIGTIAATAFRFIYYVIYLSKKIFCRRISLFIKRLLVNLITFAVIFVLGSLAISPIAIDNYLTWALCGVLVAAISGVVTVLINLIFYRDACMSVLKKYRH
jgi:O-antigen/teichoic acid export membrane protein